MRWYRRSVAYVAPEGSPFDGVRRDLAAVGLDVEHVRTVGRAADVATAEDVDCVVVDHAGEVDAVDCIDAVLEADPFLPVVVFPLEGSERLAARTLDLDVDAYVRRERGTDALLDALELAFEDLRDSRRDARGMLDSLMQMLPRTVGIYFKDRRGRHVHASEDYPSLVGTPFMVTPDDAVIHTAEDMCGMTDFDLYGPEVGEQTLEDERRIVETGEPIVDQLEETVSPDGQYVAVSSTKAPWYDSDGRLRGIVGLVLDETDRQRQRRAVERENERLDRFASVLSDDLRDPLEVALDRLEECTGDGEVDPAALEDLHGALDRIEQLITQVLELARQAAAVDDPSLVELAEPAREAWSAVEGDATLEVADAPNVNGDHERLRRLFESLFRNAVEHCDPGVTVRLGRHDRGFAVEDDGPGVPPEDRETVFEYGYTTAEDGTGLGLAVVEEIVDAHGWSIRVEESEAGGAAFVVEVEGEESATHR